MKPYTVEKEINGTTYTAQFNGLENALNAIDASYVNGRISVAKISGYIFEHVIVEPRVTANDFETMDELNKVIEFGMAVMQGNFREKNGRTAEKAGKK